MYILTSASEELFGFTMVIWAASATVVSFNIDEDGNNKTRKSSSIISPTLVDQLEKYTLPGSKVTPTSISHNI